MVQALPVCAKLQCSVDVQNLYWLIENHFYLGYFSEPYTQTHLAHMRGTKAVWFKQPYTQTHFTLNLRYKGEAHTHLSYHCEAFSQLTHFSLRPAPNFQRVRELV